ncbi:MAG: ParB N-terminal domain-containing protein [Desulfobacteraceae bacterium]|jgi:hypothetical protein
MNKKKTVKIENIVIDRSIYPRNSIDHKRVAMFEENMRDGIKFEPIHLQEHPGEPEKYRILDGAHRYQAYKGIGEKEILAQIIKLNGTNPLLYAAKQAIGPRPLSDEEARDAARRAYLDDPKLSSTEIGKGVGRARRTVDLYIADLRAAAQMDLDLKLYRMQKLGIPQDRIAHILYFFSSQNDLVIDPMAGGGVVPDTCLAFNRRCWSFDMSDRPDERPEIEPYFWDIKNLKWPVTGKIKPDLIIFDPLYFSKKVKEYEEESIAGLSRKEYLDFLKRFFRLAGENIKKDTRLVMINADWRDFQSTPAMNESRKNSIMIDDYLRAFEKGGWEMTHFIQAPMSAERFQANVVAAMQKKKILGVTSRYVIVARKAG